MTSFNYLVSTSTQLSVFNGIIQVSHPNFHIRFGRRTEALTAPEPIRSLCPFYLACQLHTDRNYPKPWSHWADSRKKYRLEIVNSVMAWVDSFQIQFPFHCLKADVQRFWSWPWISGHGGKLKLLKNFSNRDSKKEPVTREDELRWAQTLWRFLRYVE